MTERQSSFSYEDLIASSDGSMWGEGRSKLPAPPMLMMDRITTINDDGGEHGKGYIEAELDIKKDLWFFDCHFKGDPVMPGCLGLDAMWQLTGFFLCWGGSPGLGRALGLEDKDPPVKLRNLMTHTDHLVMIANITRRRGPRR